MALASVPLSSSRARVGNGVPRAPWGWAAAGALCGVLLAVTFFAPARWLASGVQSASGGRVVLAEPRGTVWNGSAQLVLTGGTDSRDATALPGRTLWQLRPALDGLHARIEAACCTPQPVQIHARPRWGGAQVQMANSQTQWPAALLVGLGTPWNTVQAQGQLGLVTQGLSVEWIEGRLTVAGQARLEALQVSSRLSTLQPMGSYRITFNGGPVPTLQLETIEGALQLTGSGSWVGSRLRFNGEASAAPDREAALSNLLNIIGRRNGSRSIISL